MQPSHHHPTSALKRCPSVRKIRTNYQITKLNNRFIICLFGLTHIFISRRIYIFIHVHIICFISSCTPSTSWKHPAVAATIHQTQTLITFFLLLKSLSIQKSFKVNFEHPLYKLAERWKSLINLCKRRHSHTLNIREHKFKQNFQDTINPLCS